MVELFASVVLSYLGYGPLKRLVAKLTRMGFMKDAKNSTSVQSESGVSHAELRSSVSDPA